jgi:hypothetical protein
LLIIIYLYAKGLGEPLRFATARAPEVRSAVARSRRAIRSITFAARTRGAMRLRWFRYYPSRKNTQKKLISGQKKAQPKI